MLQTLFLLSVCTTNMVKADEFSEESTQASGRSCSISGKISGSGLDREGSDFVVMANNNSDRSSKMARINSNQPAYNLSSLPAGHYVLRVFRNEAGSLLPVRTYPRQRLIRCRGSEIKNVDFELE
ncbi:MAG: hypothetical protein U7127_10985 [Phormidium sp.]